MAAMRSIWPRSSTPPVGFAGELMMISLVRGVMDFSNSSRSKPNSLDSRSGIGTAFAHEVDDRLVDREARIRIDDLVARARQRHDREEHDGLGAGRDDHLLGGHGDAARLGDVLGDSLAQLRQSGRRPVVRRARVQRALGRVPDVLGRVEVGLADLEVDDLLALPLQRLGAGEHLEGRFGPQPSHPFRDIHGAHYILVDFVEVAPGEFLMGDADGAPSERPTHRVRLDAFAIAVTPVTNAAYARYLAATGAAPPAFWRQAGFDDPEQPVVGVSWQEANAYAAWAR